MSTGKRRKARIGLYTTGLKAYWPQFKGLRERLEGYGRFIAEELEASGDVEVFNFGLVDCSDSGIAAGEFFCRNLVDIVFQHVGTYVTSDAVLPVHQICKAPTDVDFIDADSLAAAKAQGGRLLIAGEAYRALVVPDMIAIKRSSLEKLVEFKRAGGTVVVLGEKPKFTDAPHTEKAKIDALVAELTGGDVSFPARPSAEQLKTIAESFGTPDFRTPGAAKALHRRVGGREENSE